MAMCAFTYSFILLNKRIHLFHRLSLCSLSNRVGITLPFSLKIVQLWKCVDMLSGDNAQLGLNEPMY